MYGPQAALLEGLLVGLLEGLLECVLVGLLIGLLIVLLHGCAASLLVAAYLLRLLYAYSVSETVSYSSRRIACPPPPRPPLASFPRVFRGDMVCGGFKLPQTRYEVCGPQPSWA